MTIGTALFLALGLLIACTFFFALVIYMREFNREERLLQETLKAQEQYYASLGGAAGLPVVLLDMPKKKTKAAGVDTELPVVKTSKKNVN